MTQTQVGARITEIGRVIVPVTDQDSALEFYVGTLGFEKRADVPYGDGERWVEVAPAGGATSIALVPPRQGGPPGGDSHVILSCTDVRAVHADLAAQGVDVDEIMPGGGPVPAMFWLRDQDANVLLVVEPQA